jgi:hypothetical protein
MLKHELIPAGEADSKSLMVVLHGLGDSMEGYRWLPDAMGLPWLNYLIVNAPDDYSSGFSWYDIFENPAPGAAGRPCLNCSMPSAKRAFPLTKLSNLDLAKAV